MNGEKPPDLTRPLQLSAGIVIRRYGPLPLAELVEHLRRLGYPGVQATQVAAVLSADASRFVEQDGCWHAVVPEATPRAPRPPKRPVDLSMQQQRPETAYVRPIGTTSTLGLKSGPFPESLTFTSGEQRLSQMLRYGSYRTVTLTREPVGATPAWRVHLLRVLDRDELAYVALSAVASRQRRQRLSEHGWHEWPVGGRIDWRDHRLLLPADAESTQAAATWRTQQPRVVAGAVMHLIHDGMGCTDLARISVSVETLPARQLRKRATAEPVRRVLRRMRQRQGRELGRCLHCERPLTDEASAARGYGPECWERLMGSRAERGTGTPLPDLAHHFASAYDQTEWRAAFSTLIAADLAGQL